MGQKHKWSLALIHEYSYIVMVSSTPGLDGVYLVSVETGQAIIVQY